MERVCLIAGSGRFPFLFSQAAKRKGVEVIVIGITGETPKGLSEWVDRIYWIRIGELKKLIAILKKEKIKKVIMVGRITKDHLFVSPETFDSELNRLLDNLPDKMDERLLKAIAGRLKQEGIDLINSTTYLEELLPEKGVLTKRRPSAAEMQDAKFGAAIAKEIASLDIGQTIVVKNKAILAVEAMEGTDNTIKRGGELGKEGAVVVKMSRAEQDMRFDLPTVGPRTIHSLIQVKATLLAIEAKKTILIDADETIRLADEYGISIVVI